MTALAVFCSFIGVTLPTTLFVLKHGARIERIRIGRWFYAELSPQTTTRRENGGAKPDPVYTPELSPPETIES
jgi:hypothetical protein